MIVEVSPPRPPANHLTPAHVGDAKTGTFVAALGLCSRGVANKIRLAFHQHDFAGKITSTELNTVPSIAQLTGWARDESVSLGDLDRGIEVAKGCEALAPGGNKSGKTVKFADLFAKTEEMSESERAELVASVAAKRKAASDKKKAYDGRKRKIAVS